jgi:hypothetical protein
MHAVFCESSLITLGQKVIEEIWITLSIYVLYAGCTGNIFVTRVEYTCAEDSSIYISMIIIIIPEMIVLSSADSTGSLFILLKIRKKNLMIRRLEDISIKPKEIV